jgi:hypothetical protein
MASVVRVPSILPDVTEREDVSALVAEHRST